MLHPNASPHGNGTFTDLSAAHVRQMYFDQDIRDEVERLQPYVLNKQSLTSDENYILGEEAAEADPFMQYVRLGERVEEGVRAWLAIGANMSYARMVHTAAMNVDGVTRQMNKDAKFPPRGGVGRFTASGDPLFPTKGDYPGQIPTGGFAECLEASQ
ncbi:hypothetical protein VUR80DRAFT_994 [Thermomyces stellatus]